MITQASKVRDLGVIFDQFLNFYDHITAICRSTHFYIGNIGKIRNLLSYELVLLLFMHLLVVDWIIVILFCTMFQKVKQIDYKDFRINVRAS